MAQESKAIRLRRGPADIVRLDAEPLKQGGEAPVTSGRP